MGNRVTKSGSKTGQGSASKEVVKTTALDYMLQMYGSWVTEPMAIFCKWTVNNPSDRLRQEGTFDTRIWQIFCRVYDSDLIEANLLSAALKWKEESTRLNEVGCMELFHIKKTANLVFMVRT